MVVADTNDIYTSKDSYTGPVGGGPAKAYRPPPEIQKTVDDFRHRLSILEGGLFELHGLWYQISLFKHGMQYTHWDPASGAAVSSPDNKESRVRAVYNIMNSVQKQTMSYFIQQPPRYTTRAVTDDGEDIQKSKTGDYVLRHFEAHCNVHKKRAEVADWLTTLGNAWVFCGWDPFAGPTWTGLESPLPLGDWDFQVVPPYQMLVDPEAKDLMDARWLGRRRRVWRADLAARYPEMIEFVEDEDNHSGDALSSYELAWLRLSHRHGLYGTSSNLMPQGSNMVTVYEFWEKPSAFHPQGRYLLKTSKGVALELGPNPYGNRFPFSFWKYIPVEGSFWGRSTLHDLLYIQTEINRRESQKSEHCNLVSNPALYHYEGDGFDPTTMTNMVGQIITLNPHGMHPGMRPDYMRPPDLPMTVREMVPEAMKFVDFISNNFGVSRGEVSTSVRSGVQQMQLQEADAQNMMTYMSDWEAGWEHVYKLALWNFANFAKLPRKLKVLGDNAEWRNVYLSGVDIMDDTDVEVVPGSTMPKSGSAAFTQNLALLQAGAYNLMDPADNQRFWESLSMGDNTRMISHKKLDLEKAQRNLSRIKRGVSAMFDPVGDNPEVHLDAVNGFIKSGDFEQSDDVVKTLALYYRAQILMPMQQALNTPVVPEGFPLFAGGGDGGGTPPEEAGPSLNPSSVAPTGDTGQPIQGMGHLPT